MSYPIREMQSIGPAVAERLRPLRIRTTARLLEAAKDPKGRRELAAKTGLEPSLLLQLANMVDRMRIKGVGEDYSTLLAAAGVETVRELMHRNPKKLAQYMAKVNKEKKLVAVPPSERSVAKWIARAKELPLKISY